MRGEPESNRRLRGSSQAHNHSAIPSQNASRKRGVFVLGNRTFAIPKQMLDARAQIPYTARRRIYGLTKL